MKEDPKKNGRATLLLWALLLVVLGIAISVSGETHTWDSAEDFDDGIFNCTAADYDDDLVTLMGTDTFGKYRENPVLQEGTAGSYDGGSIYDPHLIHAEGKYHLYYIGYNGSYCVGHATSTDGLTFAKDSEPVITQGGSGDPDEDVILEPCAIYDGGVFKMWYMGRTTTPNDYAVCYATSSDGTTWTKYGSNPVLSKPTSGWGSTYIQGVSVIKVDGGYHMYLGGNDAPSTSYRAIGLATSSDGVSWSWHDSNPVLDRAPSGYPGSHYTMDPMVIRNGLHYEMYYTGTTSSSASTYRIVRAFSDDGVVWDHDLEFEFTMGSSGSWDDYYVQQVCLLHDDAGTILMYCGYDGAGNYAFGLAHLRPWFKKTTSNPSNPVVPNGATYDSTHSTYPCAFYHNTRYYIYYTAYDGSGNDYEIARAYSDSPIGPFTKSGVVLSPSTTGWDDVCVYYPCVVFDGTQYLLYYTGLGLNGNDIGVATSYSGASFTKHSGNPILTNGTSFAWDSYMATSPTVVRRDGLYHMYYNGKTSSSSSAAIAIGHATSTDGIAWTKDPANPVITGDMMPNERRDLRDPHVLIENGRFVVYFSASTYSGLYSEIGVAYSDDGTHFTCDSRFPHVARGLNGALDDSSAGMGSVVVEGGTKHLYYSSAASGTEQTTAYAVLTASEGTYVTPVLDASDQWPVAWGALGWEADVPHSSYLRFQVATNNGGDVWRFVGPDGTRRTYYEASDDAIYQFQTGRYMRVKAYFGAHNSSLGVPRLRSLSVSYGQRPGPSPPEVTLTSPNGGEDWMKTKAYPVTWVAEGNFNSTSISIFISTNNGSSWSAIVSGIPNNGHYVWTVPNTETSGAMVKIVAWDVDNVGAQDTSDATFAIDPPPPKSGAFLSPAAGDVLAPGMRSAGWVVNDPWGLAELPLSLELTTDGGVTWTVLADALPLSGGVDWDVPALAESSEACRLRLSVLSWLGDISSITSDIFSIDVMSPVLSLSLGEGAVTAAGETCEFLATADDDLSVESVTLHVMNGEGVESTFELEPEGDGTWSVSVRLERTYARAWATASDGVNEASSETLELDVCDSTRGEGTGSLGAAEVYIVLALAAIMLPTLVLALRRMRGNR